MKRISNSDKWKERLSYALTLLILIDCIVPFAWNNWRKSTSSNSGRHAIEISSKLMNALGGLVGEKYVKNELGQFDGGFNERKSWKNGFIGFGEECGSAGCYRQNITVFILPDLRRTGASDNLAAVASSQELSLEDSDAIDFYWRQDIDAEKGLYPTLWSPDLQYERDVQLVTEKTLLQPDPSYRFNDRTDALRDFVAAHKEFFGLDTPKAEEPGEGKENAWQLEKTPFRLEATSSDRQPGGTSNACLGQESGDNLALDWLNSTSSDPLNDVFLHNSHIPSQVDQGHTSSEYNGQTGDLNTPPVSMDWESKPSLTALGENRADPLLAGDFLANEFDSLPTPDLQLAPSDVACIFGDDQVAKDVAEAQTTKESILRQPPFAATDAFMPTAETEIMQFMPPMYEESYAIGTEESEVTIETMPPYGDPRAMPIGSWLQSTADPTSWSQPPLDSLPGATVSPTWTGDHDYVSESVASERASASIPNEWSFGDEAAVKTEPYESEDDTKDEFSGDDNARAASERDEVRARQLNLPFTAAEIVTMSQEDYVSMTRSRSRFTRDQVELMKEIRRHGGNKEAARRSRQRKVQMAKQLEDEVRQLEMERSFAMVEYNKLLREVEMEEFTVEELKRKTRRT